MTQIFAQKYQYELNISTECRVVQNVGQEAQMILSQPLKLDIYIQDIYLQISVSRQDIQFPFCPQKQLAQMLWIKCYYLDMFICYYFHCFKSLILICVLIVVSAQIIMGAGVSSSIRCEQCDIVAMLVTSARISPAFCRY